MKLSVSLSSDNLDEYRIGLPLREILRVRVKL